LTGSRRDVLLIVEDDLELAHMLNAYFSSQGYSTLSVAWGEQVQPLAAKEQPSLILLDIQLPDIDGFEVCRRLHDGHLTSSIPIIFLTERRERVDRLQGLKYGSVEYITKPFDIHELRLRVRNTLDRAAVARSGNTITGLPEGDMVQTAVAQTLASTPSEWGMMIATLGGWWTFRELYGFVAANDVLRVVSLALANAAVEIGGEGTFTGHLGIDTFLIIQAADRMPELRQRIKQRIGQSLAYFYPADNRGPDAVTEDRLSLWLGILTTNDGPFTGPDDLIQRLHSIRREEIVG
jgi:CheY-like chemotaxis protein